MNRSEDVMGGFARQSALSVRRPGAASLISDLLPLCDLLCLLLAMPLSTFLYNQNLSSSSLAPGFGESFEPAAWAAALLATFILYDRNFGLTIRRGQLSTLVRAYGLRMALVAGVILALAVFSRTLEQVPPVWLAIGFATGLLFTVLTRAVLAWVLLQLQRRGYLAETIAVVGAGPVADRLVRALRQSRPECVELLGIFDDKIRGAVACATKPSGTLSQLLELGKTRKIDWILLTLPATAEQRVLSIAQRLKTLSVPIGLCPEFVELGIPYRPVEYVSDRVPVNLLADRPIQRWKAVIKAGEDYILGSAATLLLLPVLAVIAVAIKLESPGPVIFRQRRHTINNREFDIYKFRSMRWNPEPNAETLVQTSRQDNRFTRLGRFLRSTSLDELPQLFNVLKGDMSLVGPRPHAIHMRTENLLGEQITDTYAHRHRVKPGITGWSQVNGARGATDTTAQLLRRVQLDLYYIENWSLMMDLRILMMTTQVVFKRTNAY